MSTELDNIRPDTIVGPYRIVRGFKGRGGMARIFEVEVREKYRQPTLPRRLALKVAREEYQDALVAESDFLRRFEHPNVARIFPLAGYHRPVYAARARFPFGWGWYYTMELLHGQSLQRHLTRPTTGLVRSRPEEGRRLSILQAVGIARQLAAALMHVHERYVLNLDVKPGNVLFRHQRCRFLRGSVPRVVLCDFGISRDLRYPRSGLLGVATPEYVSPEQAREQGDCTHQVDIRSDIFSLGIVLYEMLTGALPFEGIDLVADPAYVAVSPRQLRPSISPPLEEIVIRALEKDPARRFQTATEMHAALERVRTPLDWGAIARRSSTSITLIACLAGGGLGIKSYVIDDRLQTPVATQPPVVETVTRSPTAVPVTSTPGITSTFTPVRPTSTPAPTLTPTWTPRPPTPTPSSEGD